MAKIVKTLPLIVVLLAAPARAQAQQAAADALFESARAAMAKGSFAEACDQFRASEKLDPAVGTELNLADCEEKRGRLATAWALFRALEDKLPENDERLAVAHARARALHVRVPTLTLMIAADSAQNSTVRDGNVELGSAAIGVPLPMDPGSHELVVSAPGLESKTFQLVLAEGEARSLTVRPGGPAQKTPAAVQARNPTTVGHPDAAHSGSNTRTLGFALAGAGAASVSVAVVTGLMVLGKKRTVDAQCHADGACSSAGLAAADSGHTLQVVSNVAWVAGALSLGTAAYFVLTSAPSSKPNTTLAFAPNAAGGHLLLSRTW